ncbi:MAG TPA: hypothetical protein VM915_13715 [Verrucomicrobiae bacterium]|nr:hypothetical protein [Verrucomicrobiae bacterium]
MTALGALLTTKTLLARVPPQGDVLTSEKAKKMRDAQQAIALRIKGASSRDDLAPRQVPNGGPSVDQHWKATMAANAFYKLPKL